MKPMMKLRRHPVFKENNDTKIKIITQYL